MRYYASASTDKGIVKETNQDSVCIKIAEVEGIGQIVLGIICDGMGGLAKGEVASATLVRRFSAWFENEMIYYFENFSWEELSNVWTKIIKEQNEKLLQYGNTLGINLGTTLSAMLIVENQYMIAHVGDSRIYEIESGITQLTEDQTFIHREIKEGRMTKEEAAVHPKRNMLLQCVGASREVVPEIIFGNIKKNAVYMFCSDGFRHLISNDEIYKYFNPNQMIGTDKMKEYSRYLIELNKKRNERDNITVALLKSEL